jgi:hypothetical protein
MTCVENAEQILLTIRCTAMLMAALGHAHMMALAAAFPQAPSGGAVVLVCRSPDGVTMTRAVQKFLSGIRESGVHATQVHGAVDQPTTLNKA